jgi:hypothetical protein
MILFELLLFTRRERKRPITGRARHILLEMIEKELIGFQQIN